MYVGKSKNLRRRLSQHCYHKIALGPLEQWVKRIRDESGLKPSKLVIEIVGKERLEEQETYWISFFRSRNQCELNVDKVPRHRSREVVQFESDVNFYVKNRWLPSKIENLVIRDDDYWCKNHASTYFINSVKNAMHWDRGYLMQAIVHGCHVHGSQELSNEIRCLAEFRSKVYGDTEPIESLLEIARLESEKSSCVPLKS